MRKVKESWRLNKILFSIVLGSLIIGCSSSKTITPYDELSLKGNIVYYHENPYTGIVIDKDVNGNLLAKGSLKDGLLNGEVIIYYKSGKVKQITNYREGKLDGRLTSYYESGSVKWQEEYKDDTLEGEYFHFYENGVLSKRGNFEKSSPTGEWIFYHENGEVKEKKIY